MKRRFLKVLVAVLSLGAIGIFAAGCSVGGLEQPEWIKQALCDHVFDEKEVLREASCNEDGMTLKLCTDCGKSKIVTTPALGHTETVTKATKDATCAATGFTEEIKCSVCAEILQERVEIPALGHTFDGDTCTVCGFIDTSNYTEVAAEVGEKMLGNIYRIYCYEESVVSTDFNGFVFEYDGVKYGFGAFSQGSFSAVIGACFVNLDTYTSMTVPASSAVKFFNHYDEGYIEVYFPQEGLVLRENGKDIYITEETTIKMLWRDYSKVFRLAAPDETGTEDDELDDELTPANLADIESMEFTTEAVESHEELTFGTIYREKLIYDSDFGTDIASVIVLYWDENGNKTTLICHDRSDDSIMSVVEMTLDDGRIVHFDARRCLEFFVSGDYIYFRLVTIENYFVDMEGNTVDVPELCSFKPLIDTATCEKIILNS